MQSKCMKRTQKILGIELFGSNKYMVIITNVLHHSHLICNFDKSLSITLIKCYYLLDGENVIF